MFASPDVLAASSDVNSSPAPTCDEAPIEVRQVAGKLLVALVSMASRSKRNQADLWAVMRKSGLVVSHDLLWAAVKCLKDATLIHHVIPLYDGGVLISVTSEGMGSAAPYLPDGFRGEISRREARAMTAGTATLPGRLAPGMLDLPDPAPSLPPAAASGRGSAAELGELVTARAARAREAVETARASEAAAVERAVAALVN